MRSGSGTSSKADTRDASRSRRMSPPEYWNRLSGEQRAAAVGSLLLLVSTFGRFSPLEAVELLLALGVLVLLRSRARRLKLRLPVADGTATAAAGVLAGILILIRLFERPLGQGLLALACAGIVAIAGMRQNSKRSDRAPAAPAPAPAPPNPLDAFEEAVEEAVAPPRPPRRAQGSRRQ
jgi:hypothetical protein